MINSAILIGLCFVFVTFSCIVSSYVFDFSGQYCFRGNGDDEALHKCNHPIIQLHTKYPFVIVHIKHQKKEEGQIHVGKPVKWLDADFENTTTVPGLASIVIEFSITNVDIRLFPDNSSLLFTVDKKGLMKVQKGNKKNANDSITLQRISHRKLCVDTTTLPGKWQYDANYIVSDKNKWGSCSSHPDDKPRPCSPYYASQYYPDSHCNILPIRQSLEYLHHYLISDPNITISKREKEHLNSNETANVYFYFLGDSLVAQIAMSGDCEILSNYAGLTKEISSSLPLLRTHWRPNQFLRRDLPCNPACLSDPVYLVTDGRKQDDNPHFPTPCQACPDGKTLEGNPLDHIDVLFAYLKDIPSSVRVLVLDGGAWFIGRFHVFDGTTKLKESLQLLLPALAKLQKERDYQLDIFFLALPEVDVNIPFHEALEWDQYEAKNRLIYDILSPKSTSVYNISITILQNNQFFERKRLYEKRNVFSPDGLHYCHPGTFSPPSFFFELILHYHVTKLLGLMELRHP